MDSNQTKIGCLSSSWKSTGLRGRASAGPGAAAAAAESAAEGAEAEGAALRFATWGAEREGWGWGVGVGLGWGGGGASQPWMVLWPFSFLVGLVVGCPFNPLKVELPAGI